MRAGQKDLEPNINSQERNTYGLRAGLTRMKASYFSSGGDSRVSTNLFLGELAGRHIARNKGLASSGRKADIIERIADDFLGSP